MKWKMKAEEISKRLKTPKIDPQIVRSALEEVVTEEMIRKEPAHNIAVLVTYYANHYQDSELVECENCGGVMLDEEEECPFCGVANPLMGAPPPELDEVDDESETEEVEEKEESMEMVEVAPEDTELIVDGEDADLVAQLNREVEEIRRLNTSVAENSYELGKRIAEVYDSDLWRARRNAKGKPAYTNFKQFTEAELGCSYPWARGLIRITKLFDLQTVAEIGVTKATIASKAPEEKIPELVEAARQGASKMEIQSRIRDIRTGVEPSNRPRPAPNPADRKVTIVSKIGMQRRKAQTKALDGTPATSLSEVPTAVYEFSNDMQMKVSLRQVKKTGELQFVVEFTEIED